MNFGIAPAAAAPTETHAMDTVVDLAVRRYLDGKSDGSALFQALYGAILDEPIPEAMLALVRGATPR